MERTERQSEMDQLIGDVMLYAVYALVIMSFLVPALVGMMIFAFLSYFKRGWLVYLAAGSGLILLMIQFYKGSLLDYFGIISKMNIPYLSAGVEKVFNQGNQIQVTPDTYFNVIGVSFVFSYIYFLFAKYHWKKPIVSKYDEHQKQKTLHPYVSFRKKRLKFLTKEQKKYRSSNSKESFIGYTDFKERVSLDPHELNYHMVALGGTGTGKTTLIASLMEVALRNGKPVIFFDGKGEEQSMLAFKALAEAYGCNVSLFTESNSLTYNPVKHGTPTEVRDKLLNLFEWSEPFYKTFSSRYLQLVVKLIDEVKLPRDLKTIYDLTSIALVNDLFKEQYEEQEIEEEVLVESKSTEKTNRYEDLISDFFEPDEEQSTSAIRGEEVRIQKRTIRALREELKKMKETFDMDFSDKDSQRCLSGLRNQLGELIESDLGHLFIESDKGIDLQKITDQNDVVIFSISGSRYRDYIQKLGRMVVLDVNSLVGYRQTVGKKPIFTVYDEFSAYGNAEIVDIVNKARSAGFECIISTQSLADIDAVDPTLTDRILTNCNTLATGRMNASKDAERIADLFGTYSDHEITQQVEKQNNYRRIEKDRGTVRQVDRYRAHPTEIKNLQIGEIFISRKMKEENIGETYFRRVYVRNSLNLEGLNGN